MVFIEELYESTIFIYIRIWAHKSNSISTPAGHWPSFATALESPTIWYLCGNAIKSSSFIERKLHSYAKKFYEQFYNIFIVYENWFFMATGVRYLNISEKITLPPWINWLVNWCRCVFIFTLASPYSYPHDVLFFTNNIRYWLLCRFLPLNLLLHRVSSQMADILTKPLAVGQFINLRRELLDDI